MDFTLFSGVKDVTFVDNKKEKDYLSQIAFTAFREVAKEWNYTFGQNYDIEEIVFTGAEDWAKNYPTIPAIFPWIAVDYNPSNDTNYKATIIIGYQTKEKLKATFREIFKTGKQPPQTKFPPKETGSEAKKSDGDGDGTSTDLEKGNGWGIGTHPMPPWTKYVVAIAALYLASSTLTGVTLASLRTLAIRSLLGLLAPLALFGMLAYAAYKIYTNNKKAINKWLWLGVAATATYSAVTAKTKIAQAGFGAIAAYGAYEYYIAQKNTDATTTRTTEGRVE
jgi:hypothetical protein